METTIKNTRLSAKQINFALINETIEKAKTFVKDNDYQFKSTAGLELITETNFNEAFRNVSLKKRKKLAAAISHVDSHPTLKSVNIFFHILLKDIMQSDERVKIIKGAKQLAIEEKRKAYKDALAKLKAAYADYKKEKGDFYKIRLSKGQEIA
jgi:hypothetical protein